MNTISRTDRKGPALLLTLAVLSVLVLFPVFAILIRSVVSEGHLELANFLSTVSQAKYVETIGNSLWVGLWVVIACTIISLPLAYILTHTELERHSWLNIIFLIPFMTPPFINSMGWMLFMQKRGLLQQLIPQTEGLDEFFFSFTGMVLIMSFNTFPFIYNILKNTLKQTSSNLEEAGAVFGASFVYRVKRILLPLLTGSFAVGGLLVFVKTLSEYGTPATMGRRIGFPVFTTEIHTSAVMAPVDFTKAASLASILVFICLLFWQLQVVVKERTTWSMVGGKGAKVVPRPLSLPKKIIAWGYIAAVLILSIGIPYFSVVTTSLIKLRGYGIQSGNFTFNNYIELFTANRKGISALMNSLSFALIASTLSALIGIWAVLMTYSRTDGGLRNRASRALEKRMGRGIALTALLPQMVPHIVFAIGFMIFWNNLARIIPLYNTKAMLILAYTVLFLPYSYQYVSDALSQISPNLIYAARVYGADTPYLYRRITLPLVRNGIISAWMMAFIISFRELVVTSLIAPTGTLTVSTYIMQEFDQGSVSRGMGMAVICMLMTLTILLLLQLIPQGNKKS